LITSYKKANNIGNRFHIYCDILEAFHYLMNVVEDINSVTRRNSAIGSVWCFL